MAKTIVCSCEEITLRDIDDAIARGMADIESLKRYTGLGTGTCQGKSCLVAATRRLQELGHYSPEMLRPFTSRPPLAPVALSDLAGTEPPPMDAELPEPEPRPPSPFRRGEPPPSDAAVVIIGGGIMGLGLAYQLARQGQRNIVVLEQGYLLEGASGRNGGGVRAQFSTPLYIELARESLELCGTFAREMGINVWFRRGGYLFLARSERTEKQLQAAVRLHERHGLRTRLVDAAEAARIAPGLDPAGVRAATFNPDDGVVFPWPFVWGYADGAARLGVRVHAFTRVTGIEVAEGRVRSVETDAGRIRADRVVIACGAWSPQVAAMAGVKLPNWPVRHEICACEPLKPFVDPLVADLDDGLYFSQSMRGEIVGGMGDPEEPHALNMRSSLRFLGRYSRSILRTMPGLGGVRVLRQWAGCYDYTPDRAPILGETPEVKGLLQLSGFVGHGFMMAPAVTRRMAAWMGGAQDELFTRFTLGRFAEGRLEQETMIIG